jgi:hypothetical protein
MSNRSRLSILTFVKACAGYILVTFIATEMALFLICRPITQYWAVPPDNGSHIFPSFIRLVPPPDQDII